MAGESSGTQRFALKPSPEDDYECSECFGTYREDKEMRNCAERIQCGCDQ